MLNRKQQLISIAVLTLSTVILLVVIFIRHYHPTQEVDQQSEQMASESGEADVKDTEETAKKVWKFTPADISYFDDAIMIGDSRTVGIAEYGELRNLTFFATEGLSIYEIWEEPANVKGKGSSYLEPLLESGDYNKIYIMLGINELGYDKDKTVRTYKETLDKLHEIKPEAIIYICSNLHVTAQQSESNDIFNNKNIDIFNEEIQKFADNETFFYLDVNQKFNDGAGNLSTEFTSDNVHILAKYYAEWAEWFKQNTISFSEDVSDAE